MQRLSGCKPVSEGDQIQFYHVVLAVAPLASNWPFSHHRRSERRIPLHICRIISVQCLSGCELASEGDQIQFYLVVLAAAQTVPVSYTFVVSYQYNVFLAANWSARVTKSNSTTLCWPLLLSHQTGRSLAIDAQTVAFGYTFVISYRF
jgi:hypothetical protein